ncbi:MAG: helix-turn-helix domain containing protein [Chlorobium sp.]|uniref:helix-turn-helix domain-containing protein n=1 Tax=Chlorobium sp. TaxID=1095 RepID=UPI002F3FA4D7
MTITKNNIMENRLRMVMERMGCNQTEMADMLGMQAQNFSKHLLPEGSPNKRDPENLVSRLIKIGVSLDWLYTGKGEMFLKDIRYKSASEAKIERAGQLLMEAVQLIMEEIEEKKREKE